MNNGGLGRQTPNKFYLDIVGCTRNGIYKVHWCFGLLWILLINLTVSFHHWHYRIYYLFTHKYNFISFIAHRLLTAYVFSVFCRYTIFREYVVQFNFIESMSSLSWFSISVFEVDLLWPLSFLENQIKLHHSAS